MVEGDGSDVREDESSSGPDDQGRGQEAEALLKPPHLRQVSEAENKSDKVTPTGCVFSALAVLSLHPGLSPRS